MIQSFKCKETEKIWNGIQSRRLPKDIQDRALRKLRQLDAASGLADLKNPPSNHLEILQGNRKGQYSIRINEKWRICFIWKLIEAHAVDLNAIINSIVNAGLFSIVK